MVKYALTYSSITYMFRSLLRQTSGCYYKNTDKIQNAKVKPLHVTGIVSNAPYDSKMSDYVLLKRAKIYIVVKNK